MDKRLGRAWFLHSGYCERGCHHPHLHCVVPGGGLSPGYERWISCKPGFFLPVRVLSRLFRRLFLQALEKAFQQGQLRFFGEIEPLRTEAAFLDSLTPLRQREWVVYAKPPFGGPQQALEYLGRYTHRIALSNDRLLALDHGEVTFQWKDYRQAPQQNSRRMTLPADEFIRRFLMHTLPPRFQRIRHFGFLANRFRKEKLALCRQLLATPASELLPNAAQCLLLLAMLTTPPVAACPKCGVGVLLRTSILSAYPWPAQPPDTS
jgi:Putative transposase